MRELAEKEIERADAHHKYTYDQGRKEKKADSGVVYIYKDPYGLLHATGWEDVAAGYGRYIVTDEIGEKDGLPFVNGSVYTIFGAGEGYVYLTKNKERTAKFHTGRTSYGTVTVAPRGSQLKRASCELLRQLYLMLDADEPKQ